MFFFYKHYSIGKIYSKLFFLFPKALNFANNNFQANIADLGDYFAIFSDF